MVPDRVNTPPPASFRDIPVDVLRGFAIAVTDEKMLLSRANLTQEGVIKLSLGKKRHVLLKPA